MGHEISRSAEAQKAVLMVLGHFLALMLGLAVVPSLAAAGASHDCPTPTDIGDGWRIATPTDAHLDPRLICSLSATLSDLPDADPHGVLVVRHDSIVYEAYFAGPDQPWPELHWREPLVETQHDALTLHDLQSITKSVVAILMGIALDRNMVSSLDTPVLSFFPEDSDLRTPERERVTVRDLLTMTTGLHWDYKPYLAMARQMSDASDPYRFMLSQPVTGVPGHDFRYNNGTVELVGGVLEKATGKPLDRFAQEALFEPLGITSWEWGKMANGSPGASWGLRLRPRDLAKIGQLVLNRGTWHGRQIVSSGWIDTMTARHIERTDVTYGFLWWLDRQTIGGHAIDIAMGIGWGGQYLYVVPSLDLVVVVTAGVYDFDGAGRQDQAAETAVSQVLHAVEP